jgi:hypothetical protein
MGFIALLIGALVWALGVFAATLERPPFLLRQSLFFYYEQNVGQADPSVRFLAHVCVLTL